MFRVPWQGKTAVGAESFLGSQSWLGMAEHRGSHGNLLSKLIKVLSATACVQLGEGEQERSSLMVICEPPQGDGKIHKIKWWGWCRQGEKLLQRSSGGKLTPLHSTVNGIRKRCLQSLK